MKRRRILTMEHVSGETIGVFVLGGLFILGGVLGCLVAGNIHGDGAKALGEYLRTYLDMTMEEPVSAGLGQVLFGQLKYPVLLFFLGFTAVGVFGIPILFAARGFVFSFSVACFCRIFGWAGLLPALFLFGIPAIVWAPAFFILGFDAVQTSRTLLRKYLGVEENGQRQGRGLAWALCLGSGVVCGGLEYFVLPVLVGASAGVLL